MNASHLCSDKKPQLHTHPKFPSKSFNRLSTKHCKQDLACKHCCSCWLKHKQAYHINLQNKCKQIDTLRNQIQLLQNVNKQLNRQLNEKSKKLNKLRSAQAYMQNMKEQLLQQARKQMTVELEIKAMRIKQLDELNKEQAKQIEMLADENKGYADEIERIKQVVEEQESQLAANTTQITELQQNIEKLAIKLQSKTAQNAQLQQHLQNKTETISRLQQAIKKSQDLYLIQKNKANSYYFQKTALQHNVRNKEDYIQQLTKCSEGNLRSIASLTSNNRELKDIVRQMDTEIQENIIHEGYLKQKLMWTENMADMENLKVHSMKNDLRELKLAL